MRCYRCGADATSAADHLCEAVPAEPSDDVKSLTVRLCTACIARDRLLASMTENRDALHRALEAIVDGGWREVARSPQEYAEGILTGDLDA